MTTLEARTSARSVVAYYLVGAKRFWRSILIVGIGTPLLYVLALGVGLGVVINQHSNALGVPYLQFVAPAFLTAAAVQIGASAAAFPVTSGFKWQRTFHGMAATPLSPRQICDGQLLWIALRLLVNSTIYLAIMAAFGGAHSGWVVLAIPVATFTGTAFAAVVAALAAWVERENNLFNTLFRFVVTPMFLFSGTFYPISELPRWGQVLAWFSPLWHGTELARAAALGGGLSAAAALGHIAYLVAWLVVGVVLAHWRFRVRLSK
jgi:lipooligosaccharide transport system permease protein